MFYLNKLRSLQLSTFRTLVSAANYSTARPTVIIQNPIENVTVSENNLQVSSAKSENISNHSVQKVKEIKANSLVAAAFASLQEEESTLSNQQPTSVDKRISKASTVDELLQISDDKNITRHSVLKIVSTLAQWSTTGKVVLADFEEDPRFIKLCRILSHGAKTKIPTRGPMRGDDLSMVLGVTGDDEAAKLVASISLPQMIKVMSALAQKKRRSTPLLRSLAYNISRSTEKLDLKQCADLLYSMTVLNFPESVLFERISSDTIEGLESNKDRSAVVGSLLTSVGLLRYRDRRILDALSEWVHKNKSVCRPQDISALFQTLAVVNYHPSNAESVYNELIPLLDIADVQKPSAWVDIVWSLVLLNRATDAHISSVLKQEFIDKLQSTSALSPSLKSKLLNINGAATLLYPNYKGVRLDEKSVVRALTIFRTKEKQNMVNSMIDSLSSLFSPSTYLKSTSNSGMGFLIDAECVVDKKCNPLPVKTEKFSPEHIRVAILVYDYPDMCRGDTFPHGGNCLAMRLLEVQGYTLMIIPYTDFSPREKLIQRVQYLEKQLKTIASSA